MTLHRCYSTVTLWYLTFSLGCPPTHHPRLKSLCSSSIIKLELYCQLESQGHRHSRGWMASGERVVVEVGGVAWYSSDTLSAPTQDGVLVILGRLLTCHHGCEGRRRIHKMLDNIKSYSGRFLGFFFFWPPGTDCVKCVWALFRRQPW